MTKPTPGPWRVHHGLGWPTVYIVHGSKFEHAARVRRKNDAALIAAAGTAAHNCEAIGYDGQAAIEALPELLVALDAARRHVVETLHVPEWHPIGHCPVLDQVEAALAKARGEPAK